MQDIDLQLTGLIHDWFVRLRGHIAAGNSEFLGGDHMLLERERILLTIGRDGAVVQKTLSGRLLVSPQSMSESLAKLEHDGYIIRSKNQRDKRETIVELTPSGRERSDWLEKRMRDQAHRFLEPLSDEEKQTLYNLLMKLVAKGSAEQSISTSRYKEETKWHLKR